MNSESVKMKNNKNDKYFEIDKSSRIFQKLFLKYNRKKIKKPKTILSIYEAKKMKAENLQTEREFVINELRAHIRLNKELESNYGIRATKHYNELSPENFQQKLSINCFFPPTEDKSLNKHRDTYLKKNIIFTTPKQIIFRNKRNTNITSFTYNKKIRLKKLGNTYSKFRDNTSNDRKSISGYKTYQINKFENQMNSEKTVGDFRKKLLIRRNKSNNQNKELNFFSEQTNYIKRLVNLKKQFVHKENEIRNFFKMHDFGCKKSKDNYDYINEKYFK